MKTAPLLLAFPLLLPVCTLYAAPRELREDGKYEFRDRGVPTKYVIAKDEVIRRFAQGGPKRIFLSDRANLRSTQSSARQLSSEAGSPVELVAYPEGQPRTEENRRVVGRSVTLKLAEGVEPLPVAAAVNAASYRAMTYAPDNYTFFFSDSQAALSAAEDLKAIPGVSNATVQLAGKFFKSSAIPTDPQLNSSTTTEKGQSLEIWYDFNNQKTQEPGVPWRFVAAGDVRPYQWYLKNTGTHVDFSMLTYPPQPYTVGGVKVPAPPPSVYRPDDTPAFATPNELCIYTPFFDLLADINVSDAWSQLNAGGENISGAGVRVAVMDDGIETKHDDLNFATLFDKNNSYNFLAGDFLKPDGSYKTDQQFLDVTPPQGYNHGTGMAGLIFSRANGRGAVGVAYGARMLGYNFLSDFLEPSVIADMMAWGSERQQVPDGVDPETAGRSGQVKFDVSVNGYNSLGFTGQSIYPRDLYWQKAVAYGASVGRSTKGVVYVFSAGNEAASHGDTNHASETNSIYTIPVGSVSDMGRRVAYSNAGASLAVVAPSSGGEMAPAVLRGNAVFPLVPPVVPATYWERALGYTVSQNDYDAYTSSTNRARLRNSQYVLTTNNAGYNHDFGGTSASAAMVGGVVALMLEANPNLGYRDVKEILMRSAKVVDALNGEWSYNAMGMPVSHKYGAGLVDAGHAVAMAKVWKNLGASVLNPINSGSWQGQNAGTGTINPGKVGWEGSVPGPNGIRVEHIQVELVIEHGRRGDLGIILTAPQSGQADSPVESFLYVPHREDFQTNIGEVGATSQDHVAYTFSTVRHWGTSEFNPPLSGDGTSGGGGWKLRVYDNTTYGTTVSGSGSAKGIYSPNSTNLQDGVYVDRRIVPVANPTAAGKVLEAKVIFHGTATMSENEAPVLPMTKIVARPDRPLFYPVEAITDLSSREDMANVPRAPILQYSFKVLGPVTAASPPIYTSPSSLANFMTAFPEPVNQGDPPSPNPSFRFSLTDGILTNVMAPNVITVAAKGQPQDFTVKVDTVVGLAPGMYVRGLAIGQNARIARDGVNAKTNILTLTVANTDVVNGDLFFTDLEPFSEKPFVTTATGAKNTIKIVLPDVAGLTAGLFVAGKGIGVDAVVNSIDKETKTVNLSVPNRDAVDGEVRFSTMKEFAALQKGQWNVEASATNIFGKTRKRVVLDVRNDVRYNEWVNTFYPPITDPQGDPDGDGIVNVVEFATGGEPYVANPAGVPTSSIIDGKLVFRYPVDSFALGAKVEPKISSDLVTWIDATPVLEAGSSGNIQYYTVTLDIKDPRKFFRLNVKG